MGRLLLAVSPRALLGIALLLGGVYAYGQNAQRGVSVEIGTDAAASPAPSAKPPQKYAIVIGVGAYTDSSWLGLPNTQQDAEGVRNALTSAADGFPPDNVLVMLDSASAEHRPTRANIIGCFTSWMSLLQPQDMLLFYFAGHGVVDDADKDKRFYLVPQDCRRNAIADTAVPYQMLMDKLSATKVQQSVIILDACQSAAGRGAGDHTAGMADSVRKSTSDGYIVLAACGENQTSNEIPEKNHGAFTWFLMEGLAGTADTNRDGNISAIELFEYSREKTSKWAATKGYDQKPFALGKFSEIVIAKAGGRAAGQNVAVNDSKPASVSKDNPVKYMVSLQKGSDTANTGGDNPVYESLSGNRFTDNGDGTISDSHLKVEWQKTPLATYLNFNAAADYCEKLEIGGKSGWRLPSAEELVTLTRQNNGAPELDTDFFDAAGYDRYWASGRSPKTYEQHQTVAHTNPTRPVFEQRDKLTAAVRAVRGPEDK